MTIQGPAPATTDNYDDDLDWSTIVGSLLLIDVGSLELVVTRFGETNAIRCDVHDIDTGKVYENTMAWGTVLVRQLTPRQGTKVAGRLTLGTAKNGRSAPYVLTDPTPEELAAATAYDLARNAPQPPAAVADTTAPF